MPTLAEFLKGEGQEFRAKAPERERRRQEWLQALERLFQQMEEWVRQADDEKVLRLERRPLQLRDPIGTYSASILVIDLCGRTVEVIPVAWNVASSMAAAQLLGGLAEGRVDLTDGGRSKYLLYRREDRWVIIDHDAPGRIGLLDRGRFEAALVDLLR